MSLNLGRTFQTNYGIAKPAILTQQPRMFDGANRGC
jgi:hypothetical protein